MSEKSVIECPSAIERVRAGSRVGADDVSTDANRSPKPHVLLRSYNSTRSNRSSCEIQYA